MSAIEQALEMHEKWNGKIETTAKAHVNTREDLAIAYTPGVAEPCKVIAKDPDAAYKYTMKANTIAVVSDGSAVLGLGNIGAKAAMPVMEGKAVLFKEFGGVNAVPICLDTQDTEEIIKTVVNIAGDGCFRMNMNEIATAARHNIPVIQVVINNHVLGMVRQWQNLFYDERYSETILPDLPDFVKVAEAYNWQAERVEKPEDLEGALKRLIEADRPALLDMRIDSDENVFPMVPAGAPLTEMFGYIKVGPNGELIDERKEEK